MNSTIKVTIFCIVCILADIVFLNLKVSKKEDGSRDMRVVLQNLFNIPLALAAISVNFIEPHNDPMLGLWAIAAILILIPTAIGYLIFVFICPASDLVKKVPRPALYWVNVAFMIAEAALAPLMLI